MTQKYISQTEMLDDTKNSIRTGFIQNSIENYLLFMFLCYMFSDHSPTRLCLVKIYVSQKQSSHSSWLITGLKGGSVSWFPTTDTPTFTNGPRSTELSSGDAAFEVEEIRVVRITYDKTFLMMYVLKQFMCLV